MRTRRAGILVVGLALAGCAASAVELQPEDDPHVEVDAVFAEPDGTNLKAVRIGGEDPEWPHPDKTPPQVGVQVIHPAGSSKLAGVALQAAVDQHQLLRGGDEVFLSCTVKVNPQAEASAERQPLDLALVLDVSGSMEESMDLLKQATLGLVEGLESEDMLTVVAYSNYARVIYSGTPVGEGADRLEDAVDALESGGSTNLSNGLQLGAQRLLGIHPSFEHRHVFVQDAHRLPAPPSRGRARRLVLMTDGLANRGETDPQHLALLAGELRGRGLSVSTVGLGVHYDELLLGSLADAGGGHYHYVADADQLEDVYRAEARSLRGRVATSATLSLRPASGVTVEEIYSWPSTHEDGRHEIQLGDLARGAAIKVVARLRVTGGTDVHAIGDLQLGYASARAKEAEAKGQLALEGLTVALIDDADAAAKSRVPGAIREDVLHVQVAKQLRAAQLSARAGRFAEARQQVMDLKKLTGSDAIEYESASGKRHRKTYDDLADDMAEDSDDGRAAQKWTDEASRSFGR